MTKLILSNPLSPGDILMSTSAFRDLHLAYPGQYQTDFRVPTGAEQIFENNPHITKIEDTDPEAKHIRLDYPSIHISGSVGCAFASAHTEGLADNLKIKIPITKIYPDIFLSDTEKNWVSPVALEYGYVGRFWLINSGIKSDYTAKKWFHHQEVVDDLAAQCGIKCVQIGQLEHDHPPLERVLDMRGKLNLRQLFRLSYHADGAISAVSLQMVVMMALQKPCVVIAGAREGTRWQIHGAHRYLCMNGSMSCAPSADGCWISQIKDCKQLVGGKPLCMKMIKPQMVVDAVMSYYEGGRLK